MNQEPASPAAESKGPSTAHLVHSLMQFLRVLRHRWPIVAVTLAAAALVGGVYFLAATRVYEAKASLLVLQSGPDSLAPTMTADGQKQGMMPTFERLFTSNVVLEGALARLQQSEQMPPESRKAPRADWVDLMRDHLRSSTVRRTNIIEIGYRSEDRGAAVAAVNAVVRSYLDFIDKNHRSVAAEINAVLNQERARLEERMVAKERELLDAKRRYGDLGLPEHTQAVHPVVQRALDLNEGVIELQQKRFQLEVALAAVRATVATGGDLRQHLLSLEPFLGREVVLNSMGMSPQTAYVAADVERRLVQDRARLNSLLDHYGPAHPRVIELTQAIQGAEQFLNAFQSRLNARLGDLRDGQLGASILSMLEGQLVITRQQETRAWQEYSAAESQAVAMNDRRAEVAMLEHDLSLLRNLHDVMLNRIATLDIHENQADVRVAVVSEPTLPQDPVSPRLSYVAAVCLLAGSGAGVLIVYVMDVLDDRFRSPEELQEQLGAPVLAIIRKLEANDEVGIDAVQVHTNPDDVASESFRTLRTALAFSGQETDRLVVSSAEPGDGKTTVLVNLAVSYAQAGKRTLVVDADLRRPGLSNLFEMRGPGGLSEILRGDEEVAAMCRSRLRASGVAGLDILPCGPRPPDPAELLGSPRMADLMGWAESEYDLVLIDSPPVLAASDAAILGKLADGVVLVVQPRKNHRRRVLRAVEGLVTLAIRLVGVVVNGVGTEDDGGYYGYDANYGYGYGYGEIDNETVPATDADQDDEYDSGDEYAEEERPGDGGEFHRRAA
jgi:succinoglycan biosynthesis transport protein ExoP